MKKNIRYIPIFLSLLFLSGVGISSFHLHNSLFIHGDGNHTDIVQDHNFCTLCASQFKMATDNEPKTEQLLPGEESLHPVILSDYQNTAKNIQNCRAPPFLV